MLIRLSALGHDLGAPSIKCVEVACLDDAVHAAEEMLVSIPHCESVEIFAAGRFLAQVDRALQ